MIKRGGPANNGLIDGIPIPAHRSGYRTRTFYSTFQNDVDLAKTLNSGFQWYPYNPFSSNPDMSKVTGSNTGGPLVLTGDVTGPNGQIVTAAVKGSSIVGKAFGGGGYFEARLKFDPTTVTIGTSNGWPSFWSLSVEKMLGPFNSGLNDQWPGQAAGYEHYIEPDFFEFIRGGATQNYYQGTIHDWSNIFNIPGFDNFDNVPANNMPVYAMSAFNDYHYFGWNWEMATPTKKGYCQWYFDRMPVGTRVQWDQYTNQSPPVTGAAWKYGILDKQHLSVIAGTGPGANLTIESVAVYQGSTADNITF